MKETTHPLDQLGELRNQHLTGGTVVLADNECHGLIRSTLKGASLKLAQRKGSASLLLSTIENCTVLAVTRQRDFRFFRARFVDSTFHGTYSGIDFGNREEAGDHSDFGSVERCDFTQAILDGCRFFNVDVSTLRFPRWPHAVIENPHLRVADINAMTWPGLLGEYMALKTPAIVRAEVVYVPRIAELTQCSENEIRSALEQLGGVLL